MVDLLITGGAGFIGSATVRHLFATQPDWRVTVLDALTYAGDIRNIPEYIQNSERFSFVYGDVRNAKSVDRLVSECDLVVHFAAETHVARSIFDDALFFETDVLGTQHVANAVLNHQPRVQRFVHISTSEIYGTALTETMGEDHPLVPQSPYAAAKAGADLLVTSYRMTYGIPAITLRPFNVFGPHQHLEKLIPRFITSILLGEPLTVHGSGESSRDFTFVDDVARAIALVLTAPRERVLGHIFNIGSGQTRSINDIAQAMLLHGRDLPVRHTSYALNVGDRPGQVFRHTADARKLRDAVDWQPTRSFEEGLRQTVQWYRENEAWWRPKLWMRHVPIRTESGAVEYH